MVETDDKLMHVREDVGDGKEKNQKRVDISCQKEDGGNLKEMKMMEIWKT